MEEERAQTSEALARGEEVRRSQEALVKSLEAAVMGLKAELGELRLQQGEEEDGGPGIQTLRQQLIHSTNGIGTNRDQVAEWQTE